MPYPKRADTWCRQYAHYAKAALSSPPMLLAGWRYHPVHTHSRLPPPPKTAMKHRLTEPIPDVPTLASNGDQEAALSRLLKSLADCDAFNGALKPHFADGALDKPTFAAAHATHGFNHLIEFSVV